MSLRVSLVINTYNRMHSLPRTLVALEYLRHPELEVIVVDGPSTDGTEEYLQREWAGRIKFAKCPVANLSVSRNIGIMQASGDIVAFTDDDGIPEPDWLDELLTAYADPSVGAAGGFVRNHTGVAFQTKYIVTDRNGDSKILIENLDELPVQRPGAPQFPGLIGVNSSFRRSALLAVGGFDEEYAYFLDESDVIVRLVDAGQLVRVIPTAEVHHKYAPSHIRREDGLPHSWVPILRSSAYFCLRAATPDTPLNETFFAISKRKLIFREHTEWAAKMGNIDQAKRDSLVGEIEAGAAEGIRDAFAYPLRRLLPKDIAPPPWLAFQRLKPAAKRLHLVFVTSHYPPRKDIVGGIGMFMYQLARRLARDGHEITVITRGEAGRSHTVDFEERVWVHRLPEIDGTELEVEDLPDMPIGHKRAACGVLAELERVSQRRRFDWVIGTIWDMDLAAVIASRRFPVAMYLVTSYQLMLDSKPEWTRNADYYESTVAKMIATERWALARADKVLASTRAILRDVETAYGVSIPPARLGLLPFGIDAPRYADNPPAQSGRVRLLYVGRFEERKGIDVLFECLPDLLARYPELDVHLVGEVGAGAVSPQAGSTYKTRFFEQHRNAPFLDRITCFGFIPDTELEAEYRDCDVFVAPSRYESFGLIYLEAMRYGKPCIGCRAGGIPEIIVDGETGLLAEPGDAQTLASALDRLVADATLRGRFGAAGRARFLEHFTVDRFAQRLADEVGNWLTSPELRADHA